MKIIKDREIVEDNWLHLDNDADVVDGNISVSLARWLEQRELLLKRDDQLGVRLNNDDSLDDIVADLAQISMIALDFPVFTDGRSYSLARLLRDRYDYEGEIRARGDVLLDQLFYMSQCGFSSFEMAKPEQLEQGIEALDTFSESYQATALRPQLYRRRQG